MTSKSSNSDERFPTAGPETKRYERYESATTENGKVLIYDTELEDRWIQADTALRLSAYR